MFKRTFNRIYENPKYVPAGIALGIALVILAVVLIALGYINLSKQGSKATPKQPVATNAPAIYTSALGPVTDAMQVTFAEVNNSAELGTFTLKEIRGKVYLEVALTGAITSEPQPAYVYEGSCDEPGRQLYSLSPVVNGKTANYLNVTLADFKKEFPAAVVIHKSVQDINSDIACANLVKI